MITILYKRKSRFYLEAERIRNESGPQAAFDYVESLPAEEKQQIVEDIKSKVIEVANTENILREWLESGGIHN